MARILSEIGWQVTVVEGGYKSYRKQVLDGHADRPRDVVVRELARRTDINDHAVVLLVPA